MKPLLKSSGCKINLLLNILGKRADGFHELETIMHPVAVFDTLAFQHLEGSGIALTCSDPMLPVDSRNLVYRAAERFLSAAEIKKGVGIHLEKKLPMAAGLGGGSGNAATTLLGLNELFGQVLGQEKIIEIAASLGSDIPFFLQTQPALASGRGEKVRSLPAFPALKQAAFLLIYPGFGIATAWAYQSLAKFREALRGRPGRSDELLSTLAQNDPYKLRGQLFNSLENPALEKYPILQLFQEIALQGGACATLMSGSGSTTFAICEDLASAKKLETEFRGHFGESCWLAVVPAHATG